MAVASWMLRNRNRSARFNRNTDNEEHFVRLDVTKDPNQNIKEIFENICQTGGISDIKRLNYLNAFVKLTLHINGNFTDYGYTIEDIFCCLRVPVVHESSQVRSGGFRAIRHIIKSEDDVLQFNNLLMPFLIARSLDLAARNDAERIEVLKLVRKLLMLSPSNFDVTICRSLVSLANGGIEEKDRMLRACLAILSELGTLNPELFIRSGGVTSLMRNLMECQTPRIAEALCGVLLLLLDKPYTRELAAVDLHCVAAPYCDFHYRHGWMDKNRDERELRFNCSRLALLSILRSWPGILHFCSPTNPSGLKAIVDVLYLNQLEVRKAVLDLLYELLGLPQPEWTDELSVALSAIDPAELQSSWRLNEGFVAAEGKSILPHLAKTSPSIKDMHMALLLYCFLENGLLNALSEVIATSDTFISVRAIVLLGELLRLIQVLLPPECCNVTPALPNLIEHATRNCPQALRAITALQQLHKLLKRRPASYSLYMDFILQSGHFVKTSSKAGKTKRTRLSSAKTKLTQFVGKEEDLIKETGVLTHKDALTWNWNLIRLIIRGESDLTLDATESNHRTFLKRLVEFYMPSMNRYSHMDLTTQKNTHGYTMTGTELIGLLMEMGDPETTKLLINLFIDISVQIAAIISGKSAHDCLFSPQHMANTQCQSYFLFIGRLGSTPEGVTMLKDLSIFNQLMYLATTTNHDCYVKLIISSLDYFSGPARDLISAVLTCPVESSRLYATQFLLVLLRAGQPHFSAWGIKLLTNQLMDRSRAVRLSALSTLHEACEVPSCLEQLIKLNPDLLDLGEKGVLLMMRFLSVDAGFQLLNKNDFIANEIGRWDQFLNFRYVRIVEGDADDMLTLHQRGEDGRYSKHSSSAVRGLTSKKDLFLPPHIYGQLARHSVGFQMLLDYGSIDCFIQLVQKGVCSTDPDHDILKLKSAIWALAQFASTERGIEHLQKSAAIASILNLAQTSMVFSIRATAYFSLGLVATTRPGADCLFRLGWVCTRHDRHDKWPVIEDENWELERLDTDNCQMDSTHMSLESERVSGDHAYMSEYYYCDNDDGEFLFPGDGGVVRKTPNKSSTLPAGQTQSSITHKRSLSESKTFEMLKCHEQRMSDRMDIRSAMEIGHRHRNNSTTESTTSGVSSCDSVLGKTVQNERIQTLSPIPSSSSLNTLRKSGAKPRRHSESSRTASVQSATSDRSTLSPAASLVSKLSYQDRIGYETYRSLRQYPIEELTDFLRISLNSKSYLVYMQARQLTSNNSGSSDGSMLGHSLASLSSVQKFVVKEADRPKGACYLGICLPQKINAIFTESAIPRKYNRRFRHLYAGGNETSFDSFVFSRPSLRHQTHSCMKCSRTKDSALKATETEACSTSKLEDNKPCSSGTSGSELNTIEENSVQDDLIVQDVLQQIERLSNPILIRQAKQSLLHHKQRHPHVFQDICIYSDVCRMVSENTFRLGPRRVLQELFLDVSFETFVEEAHQVLAKERRTNGTKQSVVATDREKKKKGHSLTQQANERRKQELASAAGTPYRSVKGFSVETQSEGTERFSPTRFEPRSPPLSSVKEELASNENLLNLTEFGVNKDNKTVVSPTITTLDSMKFTYKENKFPVKHRDDPKTFDTTFSNKH